MISSSFASSVTEIKNLPSLDASKIYIPVGKSGQKISLLDLSKISQTDLETLTGKKMNFLDRIAFKKTQKKLNKKINAKGIITDKKINKFFRDYAEGKTSGFHGLGFVLGFFLNWVGIILAYVINDDEDKKNRVKWAWIGFGISVVLWIVIYAALIAVSI
jgi:hypothetical protein